jgi:hypothetical protein
MSSRRVPALVLGVTVLAFACLAYLQVTVPIAHPTFPAGVDRHFAWLAIVTLAVAAVDGAAVGAGLRLGGRRVGVRTPNRSAWARNAWALFLRVCVGATYAALLTTIVLGVPVSQVAAATALPLLVLLVGGTGWYFPRFGFLAVLACVGLVQTWAVADHASQLVQLLQTDGDGAVSKGILGELNPDAVTTLYALVAWAAALAIVVRFVLNRWGWAALAISSALIVDAAYSLALFNRDFGSWGVGGRDGVFSAGGALGLPFDRPYVQAGLTFLVAAASMMALVAEAARSGLAPRVRVPARLIGAVAATTIALPTVVVTGATIAAGASPLCTDVATSVGLDFSDPYGATPATNPLGITYMRNLGQGAAVGDYTGDGFLDVYLLGQLGMPSRLYHNVPAPGGGRRFIDVTSQAGLAGQRGLGRVAFFADLNNTGRPDLVVLNDYAPGTGLTASKIYRNNGDGTFTDVTAGSGFDPAGYVVGGASLGDFFGDGHLDIYVSYWTEDLGAESPFHHVQGQFPGHNELFRNLGNYQFVDVTNQVRLNGLTRDSFSSVFADFRRAGRLDLFQAVDHRTNLMYANNGGVFQDISNSAGVARVGNNMGVAAASLYGDGLIDLYTTDITDPTLDYGTTQGNALFIARRAGDGSVVYSDQAAARGVRDSGWGWGTAFVDTRLSGHLDLFAAQGMREMTGLENPLYYGRSHLFLNDGSNHFTDTRGTGCDVLGDQRAVVPFDFNRDGAPDMLVTQVNAPVQLLENQTRGRHWLTVDLSHAGPEAAGAEVSVTLAGHTETQLVLLGGSYLAGPPLEAYFGLGASTTADSVSVRWANGGESVLRDVSGDQVLKVSHQ